MTSSAAPRGGTEAARAATIIARILRVPVADLGPFDRFASFGMDSLMAMEVGAALEDELGVELPPTALYDYPDLDSLGRFLDADDDAGDAASRLVERMRADAVLPAEIAPVSSGRAVPAREARGILVTGATGFVGAHLLRALLDGTNARLFCLVRAAAAVDGRARIESALAAYGLAAGDLPARVEIVPGDLCERGLGLTEAAFRDLAAATDAIYHAGAAVNWVLGYDALRDANVLGTRELLRLACLGSPKPLHFLSSVSVLHSTTGPRTADELADPMASLDGLHLGYAQSKCVAEALVRSAGDRGLPVTIIRPSLITGSAATGRTNIDDLTSRVMAGCVQLRAAPDLDWRMDCVPVDDVVRSIVAATRDVAGGRTVLHLTARAARHWRECVLWMRLAGYELDLIPYRDWADRLRPVAPGHPLAGLRAFFLRGIAAEGGRVLPELFEESRRPAVGAAASRDVLHALGEAPRDLDADLLARYFDDFVRRGAVPERGDRPRGFDADRPRVPVLDRASLAAGLGAWLGGPPCVDRMTLEPFASDDSIVAELTALRARTATGLFVVNVVVRHAPPADATPRTVRLFIKAKPDDRCAIDVALAVARLCSPALGEAVECFREHLGFTGSHLRELAVYANADERMRRHLPRAVIVERNDAARRWLLGLEAIDDAVLMNATEPARWSDESIDTALAGLAELHAAWFAREAELATEPWLGPVRDAARRVEMTPLWSALAEHACARSPAWSDPRLRRVHASLVDGVSGWAACLDDAPRTLIHNDFNPRNIAIRGGGSGAGGGLRLCAFDWELATLGVPQRDLAELLCFVLPRAATPATVRRWVERYRLLLAASTGAAIDRTPWETAFAAALCEVLVDRLASYAMADRIRPQRFLTCVTDSWLNIHSVFPWTR